MAMLYRKHDQTFHVITLGAQSSPKVNGNKILMDSDRNM